VTVEVRREGFGAAPTDEPTPALPTIPAGADLGPPIAGARVDVWLEHPSDFERLGSGETGADGRVVFQLRALAWRSTSQLARARVHVEAYAPLHFASRFRLRDPEPLLDDELEPRALGFLVVLEAGRAARGRVLLPGGAPAPRAKVVSEGRSDLADPDGRYALPLPAHGSLRVSASAPGYGPDELVLCETGGTEDVVLADLRLERLPTIPGVVRHEDGTPVADFSFVLVHQPRTRRHCEWTSGGLRTDERGCFEVPASTHEGGAGACDGYLLRLGDLRLHRLAVVDEERDGALTVTLLPTLLFVTLLDERRVPLPGETVRVDGRGCAFLPAEGVTDARGQVCLPVPSGARVRLLAVLAGGHVATAEFDVPEVGRASRCVLRAPPRGPLGRLALRARRADGRDPGAVRVTVLSPWGPPVATPRLRPAAPPLWLPAGTYNLSAVAVTLHDDWGPREVQIRTELELDSPVEVRPCETTTATLTLRKTAGLALVVSLPERGELPSGATCVLEDLDGRSLPPENLGRWLRASEVHGDPTAPRIVPSLLEPGRYRVTFSAPGYRTFADTVVLEADRLVTATWRAEPQR
jgi:hypothetical protein